MDAAAKVRRQALAGASGPAGLVANAKIFWISCFACIGGLLYGYNQGVFSGILAMNSFQRHLGEAVTDSTRKGWITAIFELGAWFGTLYTGVIAEKLSRKYCIMINAAVFIIGVIVQITCISGDDKNLMAGRFVTGIGVGSLSTAIPIYNAEVAPPEVRGSMVALQQMAITTGILIAFWIDYGTNYIGGTGSTQKDTAWLLPICLQLAPAAILLVGMYFMPFSPRWLIHHGREEEALSVLASLRELPSEHELIQLEFLEIKAQSQFEIRTLARDFPDLVSRSDWSSMIQLEVKNFGLLFKNWGMFRRVIIATVTMFFQQFTGINAILYYAPQIFMQLGMSSNTTSLLATGVVGIVMWLATIPAVLWIDKLGRKPVLIVGAIGMATCHIIIAVIFAKNEHQWDSHPAAGWAAVAMVWLFVIHFGYSWGPCAWVLIAEIWPLSVRAKGTALGASSNWMNNFIIGQVTPDMLEHLTYGTYIFFGVITFMGAAFIYFFTPETKQLSLEEMDLIFGSEGVAAADAERQAEINKEIGLEALLEKMNGGTLSAEKAGDSQEENIDHARNEKIHVDAKA